MFIWQTPKLKCEKVRCSLANTLDMGRDAQEGVVSWPTPKPGWSLMNTQGEWEGGGNVWWTPQGKEGRNKERKGEIGGCQRKWKGRGNYS